MNRSLLGFANPGTHTVRNKSNPKNAFQNLLARPKKTDHIRSGNQCLESRPKLFMSSMENNLVLSAFLRYQKAQKVEKGLWTPPASNSHCKSWRQDDFLCSWHPYLDPTNIVVLFWKPLAIYTPPNTTCWRCWYFLHCSTQAGL